MHVPCERYGIKNDERENFQVIFIDTKKIHENRFLTNIYNKECVHFFSIRKSFGILVPHTIFQRYRPDTFNSIAMENPHKLFIFYF